MGLLQQYQVAFLEKSVAAGKASAHPFPQFAACETALETTWGTSKLTLQTNNLFGQKRDPSIPFSECIYCDTREQDAHGHFYTERNVAWPKFATWTDSYNARLRLLERLAPRYPATYGAALKARTGEDFVRLVSKTWSTLRSRPGIVLAIYNAHKDLLE